jgi:uroporphyrin-III C-methyltransferase
VIGSLVVVGTGIGAGQLTIEARTEIAAADRVFVAAADALTEAEVGGLNANASSLSGYFENGRSRQDAYELIVEAILAPARDGERVCAAFYGHPGMFVLPAGEAIRRAQSEGIPAKMLPGVSSLDCLFADLGVDPAAAGLQTYEATDFLRRAPGLEPRASLVLWQVGVVESRAELAGALRSWYPERHELVVYEASSYPGVPPRAEPVALERLERAELSPRSTLYVPPLEPR